MRQDESSALTLLRQGEMGRRQLRWQLKLQTAGVPSVAADFPDDNEWIDFPQPKDFTRSLFTTPAARRTAAELQVGTHVEGKATLVACKWFPGPEGHCSSVGLGHIEVFVDKPIPNAS